MEKKRFFSTSLCLQQFQPLSGLPNVPGSTCRRGLKTFSKYFPIHPIHLQYGTECFLTARPTRDGKDAAIPSPSGKENDMKRMNRKFAATMGTLAVAMIGLTACSTGTGATSSESAAPTSAMSSSSAPASPSSSAMASESAMDPAANLVGSGCAAYAKAVPSGDGSVAGMAKDPVAVAASNNPLLKTLTAAVSGKLNPKVDLVDTLNGGDFTVFAPVDEAFAAIPADDLKAVVADADTLSSILTYHVVAGQIAPSDIDGTHKTVEGQDVKVTGSGDDIMVNGAKVICGGVQTANATVYLIDKVLMPPAKK